MIVKICGLTRIEDTAVAESLGANVLGMICGVPESPRNNSPEKCKKLIQNASKAETALLFRNSSLKEVLETVKLCKSDIVHFCGDEDNAFRSEVKKGVPHLKIWQTIGIPLENTSSPRWLKLLDEALIDTTVENVVLDSKKSGKTGGTGLAFPFKEVSDQLKERQHKILIAGGLKVELLDDLFSHLQPLGLDISSGVEESPGIKSRDKMNTFFQYLSHL